MSKKFTSTVAGASILLTVVGLMSRGLGLIREIVFAGAFGLSKSYDLFLVGTVIPLTLNTVLIYIAQNYFIPVYNRLKSNSSDQAKSFAIKSFAMFIAGGFILMSILFLLSSNIISLYVNDAGIEETKIAIEVFKIYTFTIPFNSAISILSAYLYSEFDFKLPTISQLFVNISVIIIVFLFAGEIGVISIAYGYLLGTILQLGFILIYIFRSSNNFLTFNGKSTKLFYWDSSLILVILIEALSQIYLISDRYFLNQVDKGGIAALNYSMNLFLLPISIISIALSTALFPSFSKSFVENNVDEINEKLGKFFSVNLYLFVPLTFIMFLFGDVIIKILFQRGAFNSNDSYMTFETLKFFSVSLMFYSSYAILNKLMYSIELIKQLLLITILGCALKVIFNFILVSYMKQDGLALSSSISYIFFFSSAMYIIKRKISLRINSLLTQRLYIKLGNVLISFLISALIINLISQIFTIEHYIKLLQLFIFLYVYFITSFFIDREGLNIFLSIFPVKKLNIEYSADR